MIKKRLLLLVLSLLSGCSAPSGTGSVADGPEQISALFYRVLLANPVQGIGKPALYRPFTPLLQQSLWLQMVQANEAEEVMQQRDKAYHSTVDGVIFTSWYQGISDFTLEGCDIEKRTAHCRISLIYRKPDTQIEWQDVLLLKQGRLGWQIEDVIYDKTHAFSPRSTLSQRLEQIISLAR